MSLSIHTDEPTTVNMNRTILKYDSNIHSEIYSELNTILKICNWHSGFDDRGGHYLDINIDKAVWCSNGNCYDTCWMAKEKEYAIDYNYRVELLSLLKKVEHLDKLIVKSFDEFCEVFDPINEMEHTSTVLGNNINNLQRTISENSNNITDSLQDQIDELNDDLFQEESAMKERWENYKNSEIYLENLPETESRIVQYEQSEYKKFLKNQTSYNKIVREIEKTKNKLSKDIASLKLKESNDKNKLEQLRNEKLTIDTQIQSNREQIGRYSYELIYYIQKGLTMINYFYEKYGKNVKLVQNKEGRTVMLPKNHGRISPEIIYGEIRSPIIKDLEENEISKISSKWHYYRNFITENKIDLNGKTDEQIFAERERQEREYLAARELEKQQTKSIVTQTGKRRVRVIKQNGSVENAVVKISDVTISADSLKEPSTTVISSPVRPSSPKINEIIIEPPEETEIDRSEQIIREREFADTFEDRTLNSHKSKSSKFAETSNDYGGGRSRAPSKSNKRGGSNR